jgi:hypothetical protein
MEEFDLDLNAQMQTVSRVQLKYYDISIRGHPMLNDFRAKCAAVSPSAVPACPLPERINNGSKVLFFFSFLVLLFPNIQSK